MKYFKIVHESPSQKVTAIVCQNKGESPEGGRFADPGKRGSNSLSKRGLRGSPTDGGAKGASRLTAVH